MVGIKMPTIIFAQRKPPAGGYDLSLKLAGFMPIVRKNERFAYGMGRRTVFDMKFPTFRCESYKIELDT